MFSRLFSLLHNSESGVETECLQVNKTKQLGHIAGNEMEVAVEMEQCGVFSGVMQQVVFLPEAVHTTVIVWLGCEPPSAENMFICFLLCRSDGHPPPLKKKKKKSKEATESAEACAR